MNDFAVLKEFLDCSLRSGDEIVERFSELKGAVVKGFGSRKFVYVPGKRKNRVLLIAHADTAWDRTRKKGTPFEHKVVYRDGVFRSETESVGVGADDRAGCAILWLLKDSGHSILVVDGQEQQLKGSSFLQSEFPEIVEEINETHQFAIEYDRSGENDFKCYNVGTDDFRSYVAEKTGFKEPDRSGENDISVICKKICGVNLSVGYHYEHRPFEKLDFAQWENTLNMNRKWLSEKNLPKFILK